MGIGYQEAPIPQKQPEIRAQYARRDEKKGQKQLQVCDAVTFVLSFDTDIEPFSGSTSHICDEHS
jgi:hypothetical protein